MILLILIFVVFLFIVQLNKMDRVSRIVLNIFIILWGLALCGSYSTLDGKLYPIKTSTIILVVVNVVAFMIGFMSIKISSHRVQNISQIGIIQSTNKLLGSNVFRILFAVVFIYIMSIFMRYYEALLVNSMHEMREDFFSAESEVFGGTFYYINHYIIQAFMYVVATVLGCVLLKQSKSLADKIWMLLMLLLIIIYSSLGGGRFNYIKYLGITAFVYFIVSPINKNGRFKKIVLGVAGLLGIYILLMFTTQMRSSSTSLKEFNISSVNDNKELQEDTSDAIINYFCGPITALNYAMTHNYEEKVGIHGGRLVLSGLESPIHSVFHVMGLSYTPPISKLGSTKQSDIIKLGPSHTWNALYTWLLWFYLDWNILGVFFFPFIFGRIYRCIFRKLYIKQSLAMLVLCSMMFIACMFSMIDFSLIPNPGCFYLMLILWKWEKISQAFYK